jgi:hypothetical protein
MTDLTEIMLNVCYGGFGLSNEAMEEYRRRCPGKDDVEDDSIDRHDSVMVNIVKEIGTRSAGAAFAEIRLVSIPSQYVKYYSINEYDGNESVTIHYNRYKINSAKETLQDPTLTKSDKLERLSAILYADLDKRGPHSEFTNRPRSFY